MESGWIMWVALLAAWILVGFVVAYIFGGFARRAEASEGVTVARKVSYLRRQKRAHKPLRSSTEAKARRTAGGRSRH
jgi:hypothetical protein